MLNETYLGLIIAAGVILCIISSCVFIFKVVIINRRKTIRVIVPVKYLPDVIYKKEIIPDFTPKITKRDIRKKKIKELILWFSICGLF